MNPLIQKLFHTNWRFCPGPLGYKGS